MCSLFLSCLFHVLLISLPTFGRLAGAEGVAAVGQYIRRPALVATLSRPLSASVSESVPDKGTLRGAREHKKRGVGGLAVSSPDDAPSDMSPTEGLNLLPIPGVDYYAINELTIKPIALGEALLDPEDIGSIVASGKIVLVLWINDQGEVVDAFVDRSDLPDIFSEAATNAFRKLRFLPGELNGQKVGTVMRIEVRYEDDRIPPGP